MISCEDRVWLFLTADDQFPGCLNACLVFSFDDYWEASHSSRWDSENRVFLCLKCFKNGLLQPGPCHTTRELTVQSSLRAGLKKKEIICRIVSPALWTFLSLKFSFYLCFERWDGCWLVQVNQNLSSEVWDDVEAPSVCCTYQPDGERRQASTRQIRQAPLDKEWDWERTISSREYNLPASPLSPFLFSLPSFSSSVIPLCISFLYTPPFSFPSHSALSLFTRWSPGLWLWERK